MTGGDAGGSRYSPLAGIHRGNVATLKVAWTYRHGDFRSARGPGRYFRGTTFEATPILVEGHLILTTPFNRAIALDAKTGKPCPNFGNSGTVNLLDGIEHLVDSWEYNVTSPPTVVGDHVIVGSSIADLTRRIQPPGAVRAYHARTGALVWRFNTIPQAGEYGSETWENESWRHTGGANVWSTMTDLERGLVFLPVSAAGPDFFVARPCPGRSSHWAAEHLKKSPDEASHPRSRSTQSRPSGLPHFDAGRELHDHPPVNPSGKAAGRTFLRTTALEHDDTENCL